MTNRIGAPGAARHAPGPAACAQGTRAAPQVRRPITMISLSPLANLQGEGADIAGSRQSITAITHQCGGGEPGFLRREWSLLAPAEAAPAAGGFRASGRGPAEQARAAASWIRSTVAG